VTWFLSFVASFVLFLLFLLFLPSFSTAEIYKWKDKDGNVVFSESPPPGSNAEEVKPSINMRVERPPSRANEPKTGKNIKTVTEQKLRDAGDINVVMYMTDW
ncbi:MAG: DUF4124 domain-containing protein, partial [Thermodesulfovibrionales bacterium]